ncbi:purine nucleoside phosphorylase LACC1-like isoform X2 [Liolophura sinensis]
MSEQEHVVFLDFFGCVPSKEDLQNSLAKVGTAIQGARLLVALRHDVNTGLDLSALLPGSPTETVSHAAKIKSVLIAKARLDDLQVKRLRIVTDPDCAQWWKRVQEVCFTPCYSIDQIYTTVPKRTVKPDGDSVSSIGNQVRDFFRSLPAVGQIGFLRSPNIPAEVFVHGFSTRFGGLSSYPGMKSLNLTYTMKKPDPEALIKENIRRLADFAGFDGGNLHVAAATHGIQVWTVGEEKPAGYDAVISNMPGVVVAAPSADCTLVLFADPVNKCCGAAHAGWRGTMTSEGIAMATVNAMKSKFGTNPKDVLVAIGPSIGTCCYEFGVEEAKQFEEFDPSCIVHKPDHPKPFVDVARTNKLQLQRGGVPASNIDMSNTLCTKCHPDKFFSYRRDGTPFGNQIGFIGIKL